MKRNIKRHFDVPHSLTSISSLRPDLVHEKPAAMRCANLCYNLYKHGRPYSDYPDQVALYCKAGIWMGDTNHSCYFADNFITSVGQVVSNKIKSTLNQTLDQTGELRPIKIIADKDTSKHRTRQLVCIVTVFPNTEHLIQHLYINHTIIKHHSTQDVADHIFESVHDFIKPSQYEGGSYDGAYHHANDSVPLKLDRMFDVPSDGDGAAHSDHDYLHRAGLSEGQVKKIAHNNWMNDVCEILITVYNDHNYGKNYEELLEIAVALDTKFVELQKFSKTRFSNHAKRVFLCSYQDLQIIIQHYEMQKNQTHNLEQRNKAEHAQIMLNKIKNKTFILKLAGLVDIYNAFSVLVSELQIVNILPYERLDKFSICIENMKKMTHAIEDHNVCAKINKNNCLWPVLHSDKSDIIKGK